MQQQRQYMALQQQQQQHYTAMLQMQDFVPQPLPNVFHSPSATSSPFTSGEFTPPCTPISHTSGSGFGSGEFEDIHAISSPPVHSPVLHFGGIVVNPAMACPEKALDAHPSAPIDVPWESVHNEIEVGWEAGEAWEWPCVQGGPCVQNRHNGMTGIGEPVIPVTVAAPPCAHSPTEVVPSSEGGFPMSSSSPVQVQPCVQPQRQQPRCHFDNPAIIARYPHGTTVVSRSPSASPSTPKLLPANTQAESPSTLNLHAKPFKPASRSKQQSDSKTGPDMPVVGTQIVEAEGWCLERVREFEAFGELEDFDELEQLEKISAALDAQGNAESDYTSSTDEEDFETTRSRQMEELRNFSKQLNLGTKADVPCVN